MNPSSTPAFAWRASSSPPWTARGHEFAFNEAISFLVPCDSQDEIDRYWDALSAAPDAERCGWLKDRSGLSWQIVPSGMGEMMQRGTPEQVARVTDAFLAMRKFASMIP